MTISKVISISKGTRGLPDSHFLGLRKMFTRLKVKLSKLFLVDGIPRDLEGESVVGGLEMRD